MDDIQSWWEVPSIAHFCSLFRAAFNLLDFDIEELEEALLTDGAEDSGSSLLQELMVRLLAGCVPSAQGCISIFNYQMFLRRLFRQKCKEYGRDNPFNTDIDFQFLPLRSKVEILHALCDFRLDADDVQDLLKNLESDSLRVEPLGHDEDNSAYWYFYGTRLYREDYPKLKKSVQDRKRKVRDDKRKRMRRKKKKGGTEDEEEFLSEGEYEEALFKARTGDGVKWQVVCYSEGDWEALTKRLHGSSSAEERALHRTLAEDFLPEIPRLFAEKERLQRKRLQENQPRRTSGRIEKLKKQQQKDAAMLEEDDKMMGKRVAKVLEESFAEKENERVAVASEEDEEDEHLEDKEAKEAERERLFQCYLAREERATRAFLRSLSEVPAERIVLGSHLTGERHSSESSSEDASEHSKRRKSPRVKRKDKHKGGGRGGRSALSEGGCKSDVTTKDGLPVGRQTNNSLSSATGPIIIQTSRRKLKSSQVRFRQSDEDLQTGLHKILERVKSHEDAWPFADPVDEEWAPRYYAVVRKPMHLRRMEEKLEAGEYLSFSHFKADFMLIVDNCRKYNGSDNEYTEMVEKIREVFQRAADRYLESDLSSDEDVAVDFPPPAGAVPGSLPGAEGGAVGGEEMPYSPRVKKEVQEEADVEGKVVAAKEEVMEGIGGRKRHRRPKGSGDVPWHSGGKRKRPSGGEEEEEEEGGGGEEGEGGVGVVVKVEEEEEGSKGEGEEEGSKGEGEEEGSKGEGEKKGSKGGGEKEVEVGEGLVKEERRRQERKREEKRRGGKEDKGKGVSRANKENKVKGGEGREGDEGEEERFGSHRKRRKKAQGEGEEGEVEKGKKKVGGRRWGRGLEGEEEGEKGVGVEGEKGVGAEGEKGVGVEGKGAPQAAVTSSAAVEEEEEEGEDAVGSGGLKKKDSMTSNKKSKSKPKKQMSVVRNAAAIDALAEATEQTLKDINKWLDDTPRFSEFSSASNSPSHTLSAEEFEHIGKGIESEYRRSLRMCDPLVGDTQPKDHNKKEAGTGLDKRGVRVDKRKLTQGSGAAGAVPAPKRTIIERLQPGKSKGNLLKQGRSSLEGEGLGGGVGVVGASSMADELSAKPSEAMPKLSLGTVLRGDIAFGEVAKKDQEEGTDEEEEEKLVPVGVGGSKEKLEEKQEVEEKVEEEKSVKKKIGCATPNLSAWFKAFGAPKGQGQRKKGAEETKAIVTPEEPEKAVPKEEAKAGSGEETKKALPEDDAGLPGKGDPEPPLSPSPSGTPHSNSGRQRHVSTGSSNVSDLSSAFSPDVVDPALSPRLVELPSHSPSASVVPPLPSPFPPVNGTIRVGFYQDTSQKSVGSVGSSGGAEEPSPTHTPSSTVPLPQSSAPLQSSDMQFYDTSKPLTDQYREVAARAHHQHPLSSPPPSSPTSPPSHAISPTRHKSYPTTAPSVIFSTMSGGIPSPSYSSPIVYPPTTTTSSSVSSLYAPPPPSTTSSPFPASDSGTSTSFPMKKRLYASTSVSSAATGANQTEGAGTSVLMAPTCSSPVGRSYHSPEPQIMVQRASGLVLPASPPPYVSQSSVPGYPHTHLQSTQSQSGFQRLPIPYHHHSELSPLHPPHPEKPEPLRSVLHHPSHSHPPHSSDMRPDSPSRSVEPLIIYRDVVEHQRRVLDLTGGVPAVQSPAPTRATKAKTTRKSKAVRGQQQPSSRQDQPPSESHPAPAPIASGFQQFRKSPEPVVAGLQQQPSQHAAPSSAFEFAAAGLALYGRDEKDFHQHHHYLRAPTLPPPPPSSGYYVDPTGMVKSPPQSPHPQQQQQPQHTPQQATVGSALPSYPFPLLPHYPHYSHHPPPHHHHLESVPPGAKAQFAPSSTSTSAPSSTSSPTTASSPSPTTSKPSMATPPSIPPTLLPSAPSSFHPPGLSSLAPGLPAHRAFVPSGNGRAASAGGGMMAFQPGEQQQREGSRSASGIVAGGAPTSFAVDHANPLYHQQFHHHHAHHLHPPTHPHMPQEELLLRGATPTLPPTYPSGHQHAFDAINRPSWL